MSNGDDVLDNWDEIDEAGLNNTLHKIQVERKTHEIEQLLAKAPAATSTAITATAAVQPANFQPMKLLQRTQSQDNTHVSAIPIKSIASSSSALKSPLDDMSASFQPVMMVLHQPVDEYQSANYMAPISSQTVKILRRPTQSSEPRNNDMRPRQPIKTLQQREQEYAEARLRILGSAKNPEDDVSSTANTNNTVASTTTTTVAATTKVNSSSKTPVAQNAYNNHQITQQIPANIYNNSNSSYNNQRTAIAASLQLQQQLQQQQQQQQQTWSPIVGGIVSSSTQRVQPQESILRMPRGPDGSTGFQTRR